ncbi:MAG: transglutaminase domain-containing protein [Actinobacteria bacterium]|nr:transglutaminase domain-containing protein [Actinomycetota bacterium]
MPAVIDYALPGPLTDLSGVPDAALPPPADPLALCGVARGLVVGPLDAHGLGLPPGRSATNQVRPAAALVQAVLALDPAPLTVTRPPARRIVGTCRHVAVLTVALLRHHGVPARARCGFATYFEPGRGVDHWVVEYRTSPSAPWRRVDPELPPSADARGGYRSAASDSAFPVPDVSTSDGTAVAGEFLTGGEAWVAYRRGAVDASRFGVAGTSGVWGPAEIKGNAIRDLAALNKVEVLPWDEWGRMADAYAGRTGPDHDTLVDAVAAVCGADDPAFVADLYARDELRVPEHLQR